MESRERNYKKALLQKLFGIIRTRAHLHKTYPLAYLHTRTCVCAAALDCEPGLDSTFTKFQIRTRNETSKGHK